MTANQKQEILRDACDTLADLDNTKGRLSKEQYLALGASLAIEQAYGSSASGSGIAARDVKTLAQPLEINNGLPATFSDFAILVEDELAGAEKYLAFYKQSGKTPYKEMARQESSHVAFWLQETRRVAESPGDMGKVRDWQKRHDEIMARLQ